MKKKRNNSDRVDRGHGLSEAQRRKVDEERESPGVDREVDQPERRSLRAARKWPRDDRGADTPHRSSSRS